MKVREDIYPEANKTRIQDVLQALAHVALQSFDSIFSSEDDLVRYINNFASARRARQFLEVGEFYHFAKFYYCPSFGCKRIEICPICGKPFEVPAYIVLIMIISIMEQLSLGLNKFTDFYDWVGKSKIVRDYQNMLDSREIKGYEELLHSLKDSWNQEYGSVTKVTEFLDNFMEKEEKVEFIKSIRYLREVPDLPPKHMSSLEKTPEEMERIFEEWKKTFEKESQLSFKTDEDVKNYVKNSDLCLAKRALPECFDEKHYWKCYSKDPYGRGLGYCRDDYHCPIVHDEKMLDKYFKKAVRTIYDWRSKFVHEAKLPPINEVASLGTIYKKKPILVDLTTTKLKPTFERMLKRYFDEFQKKE
jgi:hypothetical protein